MKRQNSFDVSNPAGSGRIDGNPAGSDRIEIGAGLQSLGATVLVEMGTIMVVREYKPRQFSIEGCHSPFYTILCTSSRSIARYEMGFSSGPPSTVPMITGLMKPSSVFTNSSNSLSVSRVSKILSTNIRCGRAVFPTSYSYKRRTLRLYFVLAFWKQSQYQRKHMG
ncbi:hypothetical protein AVEN_121118-1 [Araneus ventricosus]|uniref:Uncharacterized protein n=1 Tax=Araneus ventricosus TaxID=182803 RepID=A0A4Y2KWG3_ARAVE|nr:hypothetical protein AVEN_121118-1 [Araneus ventricosus]